MSEADGFLRDVRLLVTLLGVQNAPLVDSMVVAMLFSLHTDSSLRAMKGLEEACILCNNTIYHCNNISQHLHVHGV